MGPEAAIERLLHNLVRKAGGTTIKLMPTTVGVPDRLVLMPYGKMDLVELKSPVGRLRPDQRVWHERAGRMGIPVTVLNSQDAVRQWVDLKSRDVL